MKNAIIVLLDHYADWEPGYLTGILNQKKDWTVKYASNQAISPSIGGLMTKVDYQLSELSSLNQIDLLVLVGGKSWTLENRALYQIVRKQLTGGLPLAAICGSVDYLARSGFLNDYRHTGNAQYLWKTYQNYHNQNGFVKAQAFRDKNLVTANGTAALDFTELALDLIGEGEKAAKKEVDLYRLGFYDYCRKYGNPF